MSSPSKGRDAWSAFLAAWRSASEGRQDEVQAARASNTASKVFTHHETLPYRSPSLGVPW